MCVYPNYHCAYIFLSRWLVSFNNCECLISWRRNESTSTWRDSGMSAISEAFHAQKLYVKCFPSLREFYYPRISTKPRRNYRGVCRRWHIFIATMTYAAVSTRDSYFTAGGSSRFAQGVYKSCRRFHTSPTSPARTSQTRINKFPSL